MATEEIIEATNGAADDIKEAASDVQSDLAGVTEQVTQEVSRLAIALAQASFFAEIGKLKAGKTQGNPENSRIFQETQVFANSELEVAAEKRPKKSLA